MTPMTPRARAFRAGRVGAAAEARVIADLLLRGYDLYRAVSNSAPFDLLLLSSGKVKTLEVRSGNVSRDGTRRFRRPKRKVDVVAVVWNGTGTVDYIGKLP